MIITLGAGWRWFLGDNRSESTRSYLVLAVYEVFLPALVLRVMWQTEVEIDTIKVPLVAAVSILFSLAVAFLLYLPKYSFFFQQSNSSVGALLLASAFGNFTYLGLPVLTQAFGEWSQPVAIHFDLFASTPLLFSVGILIAHHFGKSEKEIHMGLELLRVPALWAAIVGVIASASGIPMPDWLDYTLNVLGAAVVPLMLLSVGMALSWQAGWIARIPLLLPLIVIQLVFMPLVVWFMSIIVGIDEQLIAPAVIEGAMPSMVLGLVICDRFKLDTGLYAEAVTVTTLLSLFTLPIWLELMI
ncbi:MAG: AEC family transporter [Mariprofundaceae bacterium]